MEIILKKIDEVTPYDKNPRKNDNAVKYVAESIKQFGFKVPIVIDSEGVIVCGHTRHKAAKSLKLAEVPCVVADDLTEEQIKAFRLADNKVSEFAEWDLDFLTEELDGIFEIDMEDFGFSLELDEPEEELGEDDYEEPDDVEERAKRGDIFKLGNNFVMCGDSTSVSDIEKLCGGVKVDLVFTDPPYGMKKEADGVANDNLNFDDLLEFNRQWIPLSFDALKENGSWYCFGIDEPLMDIYSALLRPMQKQNLITFRNLITWDKGNGQGQTSAEFRSYAIADEKCLFVMKGVQGFNNNADNYFEGFEPIRQYFEAEIKKLGESDKTIANALGFKDGRTVNHWWNKSQWIYPNEENIRALTAYAKTKGIEILVANEEIKKQYEEIKKQYEEKKREFYESRAYFDNTHDNMNNVWHFARTSGEEKAQAQGHATPKPLELCRRAIKSSSREGEIVLDLFGGSGSTLIACEQLHRNARIMELEPHWVDVIIDRWQKHTGERAVLVNG